MKPERPFLGRTRSKDPHTPSSPDIQFAPRNASGHGDIPPARISPAQRPWRTLAACLILHRRTAATARIHSLRRRPVSVGERLAGRRHSAARPPDHSYGCGGEEPRRLAAYGPRLRALHQHADGDTTHARTSARALVASPIRAPHARLSRRASSTKRPSPARSAGCPHSRNAGSADCTKSRLPRHTRLVEESV